MNFFLGGRGAGPGSQCGVAACTLAFATLRSQDSIRNYAFRVSMLDETGLYAPSMAHIILAPPSLAGHFCVVRLAAHVSNGLKSRIRPVVGRI